MECEEKKAVGLNNWENGGKWTEMENTERRLVLRMGKEEFNLECILVIRLEMSGG